MSAFFEQHESISIHSLAQYLQDDVVDRWQAVLEAVKPEMLAYYPQYGDSVYNLYTKRYFAPLNRELKRAGLRVTPKLPGDLKISREWGPDDDRERWMWSKITQADKTPLGTILVIFYHSHHQLDLPHPMEVVGLEQSTPKAVLLALSKRSTHFIETPALKSSRPFG